ncbi:MAG: hypothetical protein KF758_17480 [Anaerolineales bacterium]|nr:hypothetical protein [Anaerolineales bacterium]
MKPLPKYCLEVKDAVIVVQSCDEETANIGVQWRGKITYCHVALPSLEREWQKWYYSDVRPEIFDSILRENKSSLLEHIRSLNAVEQCLHPTDGGVRQISMFSTETACSVSMALSPISG